MNTRSARRTALAASLLALAPLLAQQPAAELLRATVRDAARHSGDRCAALAALQDHGALDVATVLAALADEEQSLSLTAAAIVRHEWRELPAALFAGFAAAPAAAVPLLRELAIAPRPAAAAWVGTWRDRAETSLDQRCLALAATGTELRAEDGKLLLAGLVDEDAFDGVHAAAGLLPPALADALLGKLHALLLQGTISVGRALPVLDRLSPQGYERLLGLAVTLPPAVGEELCLHLLQREVPAYAARAAAALDAQIPLEPLWLLRPGPLLVDQPARCERLLALLAEPKTAPELARRAFDALLDAAELAPLPIDDRLLDFALQHAPERLGRLRRLLAVLVARLPEARLLAWLDLDPELAQLVALALARRPQLGERLEQALAQTVGSVDFVEGPFLEPVARALLQHGSEAVVDRIWPRLRSAPRFLDFVETIALRKAPFVHELLLEELAAPVEGAASDGGAPDAAAVAAAEARRDAVRLALCAQGDRRQLEALVEHAKTADAMFVRRCGYHARPLDERLALQLLDAAEVAEDDLAAELIVWAATVPGEAVAARLVGWWQAEEPSERQEAALRALVAGPHRARMQQDLQQALAAGPLAERQEQLAFEVIAALPQPLLAADVELLASLAILPPLHDAEGEVRRAKRWPDGRFGFPLVAAVAQRLRGAAPDLVATAFAAAAAKAAAGAPAAVSRQRLLVLWRSLEADRSLQAVVGEATAALLLATPHPQDLGAGPAHWFLAQAAARRGEHAACAEHARAAAAGLLRLPGERRTARLFLGERDPAAGDDPWAALAALPHLAALRAALAAGDRAAARTAAAAAAEFAGRDRATATDLENSATEIDR